MNSFPFKLLEEMVSLREASFGKDALEKRYDCRGI